MTSPSDLNKGARPAESGHWYAYDGTPAYEIRGANGDLRPTTLRDARKLNLLPSVTGIIRCAAAPNLENWKQEQMLLAALTLPRKPDETELQWLARVRHDSKETAKKAAEKGTLIHAAIQRHYEGYSSDETYALHIAGASNAVTDWIGPKTWSPEHSFGCGLGFGGKVDLASEDAIVDFKTKEFGPNDELRTWDEHAMQLAAYKYGLGYSKARVAICYVSSSVPGIAQLLEIPEAELSRGWEMFRALLDYWQAKNKYYPMKGDLT